jgi:hypothetical protein
MNKYRDPPVESPSVSSSSSSDYDVEDEEDIEILVEERKFKQLSLETYVDEDENTKFTCGNSRRSSRSNRSSKSTINTRSSGISNNSKRSGGSVSQLSFSDRKPKLQIQVEDYYSSDDGDDDDYDITAEEDQVCLTDYLLNRKTTIIIWL